MDIFQRIFAFVTLVGVTMFVGCGYLIIRGPFLDGPMLEPTQLLLALFGFIAGIGVMVFGGVRTFKINSRV